MDLVPCAATFPAWESEMTKTMMKLPWSLAIRVSLLWIVKRRTSYQRTVRDDGDVQLIHVARGPRHALQAGGDANRVRSRGKGAGQTRSPVSDSSTQWDRTATLLHSMWSKFDKGECDTICNDAFN